MLKAAIDIGTVTTRLLIGELVDGRIDTLGYSGCITNLGEGLTGSGRISEAAYRRLLDALLGFREVLAEVELRLAEEGREETAIPVRAVATSAMRDAANASDVLAGLGAHGFDVEVISGKKEAELSFKGTLSGFKNLSEQVMSIDVGGGSTELILGTNSSDIIASHSYDIGSRRVTEMFLHDDPPSSS